MEPQQSQLYADYISGLGWDVIRVGPVYCFLKRFPIIGTIAKIHRPEQLPSTKQMIIMIRTHHVRRLIIEPVSTQNQKTLDTWIQTLSRHTAINTSPFLPTKTSRIDITRTEDEIFRSFSEAKRRAVRRATKLGITIEKSNDIDALIRIKNKSSGLFGFITTTGIKQMWHIFGTKHMTILLAYADTDTKSPVGGVLLLFWESIAYYWIAGAIKRGKKLYAPTLLIWEAVKLSKKHSCTQFDFVGVWDERLPNENTEWKGFTKFKEGFGGTTLYYPLVQKV